MSVIIHLTNINKRTGQGANRQRGEKPIIRKAREGLYVFPFLPTF